MSDAYQVIVTREGDAWLADVPSLEGAHTFARSLRGLFKSVREVIVLADDLADDAEPAIEVHYDVDDALLLSAIYAGEERRKLQEKQAELAFATQDLAVRLAKAGWSVRDSAELLELTPGRISQLTS